MNELFDIGRNLYNQKNFAEAYSYLKKAAKKQQVEAQYYLGLMYENGQGIKQERSEAYFW